jgi:hypothetical protein
MILKNHRRTFISIALSMILFSPVVLHADNEEMVSSIMKLRADVESLYTKIDENKESYKTQMKSLALQSADSEAQINRINTSIKLVNLERQKIQLKIANASTGNVELKPLLEDAFGMLETNIKHGIPFKVQERLSALDKIKTDLKKNLITPERALALLWASYDDNIRLTSEIGLFKQKIKIDGRFVLANVAKIGSVMLYFSTPDNRVGYVIKDRDGYTYKVIHEKEQRELILALFDSLNKQIRTGYFSLPNALVLTGGKL